VRAVVRAVAAWASLGLLIALAAAWPASADATDGTRLTAYGVQPSGLGLTKVVTGPDGDLWGYLEVPGFPYFIDQITPGGVVSNLYTAVGAIDDIVAGPDGDVWYAATTGQFGPALVRIAPDGEQTPFALPSGDGIPTAVAVGPDGNMWFAATGGFIGEFSPTGALTQYAIPTQGYESVVHLALGSDGALWFTQDLSDNPNYTEWVGLSTVGRMTASGAVTFYPLASGTGDARDAVLGPDGNIWFTENSDGQGTSALVSVTPTGQLTTHVLPAGAHGGALTAGPDGNLWVVENFDITTGQVNHGQVAAVDRAGEQVAAYTEPGLSELDGITTGPDGNIWYSDDARHAIIQIDLHHGAAAAVTLSTSAGSSSVAGHESVTAQVTGSASSPQGSVTPTGAVVFSVDGSPQPVEPLVDGEATLDITDLPASGSHTITAQYFGDDYFLGTTSAPLTLPQSGTPITAQGNSVVTTPAFDVTGPQLLVALVSADGPKQKQSATVTGAGLT
jgi:virginiamycin B lyase